jgi:hypothetical protein
LTDGERALQIRVDQKLNVTLILDLIHVLEKLWKAAYCFHAEGSLEADLWVIDRTLRILFGEVGQVVKGIRQSVRAWNRQAREATILSRAKLPLGRSSLTPCLWHRPESDHRLVAGQAEGNGLVRGVEDLYTFDPGVLLELPGFGEKKVAQIRAGIEKSRSQPFHVVFPSLGIPDIGQKVTELLIDAGFRDIDSLLDAAEKGDPAPLLAIHGIGERTAETLLRELRSPQMRRRIEKLRKAGVQLSEGEFPAAAPGLPRTFEGQTWCVTGSFETFTPREKATEEIVRRGGTVGSSVTSKTTHLLVGASPGSKLEKARKVGAKVVTEKEFLALLAKS